MTEPTRLPRYISLIVEKAIARDRYSLWYKCASKFAPHGVITTFSEVDDNGEPQNVMMLHRETNNAHYYMIPITRDLTEKEAEKIVDGWAERCDDCDFDIEITVIPSFSMKIDHNKIDVDQEKYMALATSWAKRQHEDWVDERIKDGWRFGIHLNFDEKTHPLLKSWDELPAQYKKVDLKQPQSLLDLMTDQGYAVIDHKDLEAVQRVLRKV